MNNKVPKTMPKKEIEYLLRKLKGIRQVSTMENSSFSEEIRNTTKGWRDFWITHPLDELIERYENAINEN